MVSPSYRSKRRRGSIMPVVALVIVGLCGFTALSVEIATIAMVKVQCQNAADSAAMAGARALNGGPNSNLTASQAMTYSAAEANYALGINASTNSIAKVNFVASEITYTPGTYHYNNTSQTFYPAYTLQSDENYNLVKTTVQRQIRNAFLSADANAANPAVTPTIVATSVAAHRPRDVAIVLDFSGSMNDESDLWNTEPWFGQYEYLTNNSDPNVPTFGHYSSSSTGLVSTAGYIGGSSNMTMAINGMPAMASSYYATTATTSPSVPAFTAQPNSYMTAPLGDIPVTKMDTNSGTNFATTANDVFGTNYTTSYPTSSSVFGPVSFEGGLFGYVGYDFLYWASNNTYGTPASPSGRNSSGAAGFSGYTMGPGYWGKTFFLWPPDPRSTKDWRYQYFIDSSTGAGVTNNTTLWDGNGNWLNPSSSAGGYQINYKAILNWIKNIGPNPFPSQLISGGITYYSYIPTDVPASAYNFASANSAITDPSVRFWKEFIDYTVGSWVDPLYGYIWNPGSTALSYGPDYAWGTVQITAKPSGTPPNGSKLAYMNYKDNPLRPRHRLWFGPMLMMEYISQTGKNAGTARDVSTFSTKLGIASILSDIQVNHPNDMVSLIMYNRPQYSNEPAGIGRFNNALYNLNRNYSAMTNSLWYPPNYGTTTITPWDSNGTQVVGTANDFSQTTATQHGMMLAYNQFSSSSTLMGLNSSTANAGGLGRVGAKRLVILETDGMANVNTSASFTNNGSNSYYNILPNQSYVAGNYDQNNLLQIVQAICNNSAGVAGTPNSVVSNPGYPGFATATKPVEIQTIGFGIVFQIPTATQTNAVQLLQQIAQIGGTTFPSSASDPTNGFKWCIGTLSQRVQLLQEAFSNVMNDGNSISIVQ